MKKDALNIIKNSINDVLPNVSVENFLKDKKFEGNIYTLAIGKAAWEMANSALKVLPKIKKGIIITKYKHSKGSIKNFDIYEAGHPISDENTIKATKKAIEFASNLKEEDTLLFLVSGGGSSLFEIPEKNISLKELQEINLQLLKSGADIREINTVRKHLSKVKGGKFAKLTKSKIMTLVLSDVLGNDLSTIASGPAYPDFTTSNDAFNIIEKYNIKISKKILETLKIETPKKLKNIETHIIGDINKFCESVKKNSELLGYKSIIMVKSMNGDADETGKFIGNIAKDFESKEPTCLIFGGETTVKVKGNGKGGRNQEIALTAALNISGVKDTIIASFSSDGTDGPTDAAGGIVDGNSLKNLKELNIDVKKILKNNDSYNALKKINSLIFTGPTGTNVNDITFILKNNR
ncbi:D-glycerate 2-kinase [Tepiditoga spiralis]|uniref:D-glycerate 2-kinase n=1 Tax=Tepiditoga spiralis TaxID=2108365 RepID=A0A7G1G2Y7_9BACT|nr:glycerate kinase [Tepiditoga spiralis]BBE30295.1 D-glycerate 2-kinase [Tepiditoga spiralis]